MESAEILPQAPNSDRKSHANGTAAELSLGEERWGLQNALDPSLSPFSSVNSWGIIALTVSIETVMGDMIVILREIEFFKIYLTAHWKHKL